MAIYYNGSCVPYEGNVIYNGTSLNAVYASHNGNTQLVWSKGGGITYRLEKTGGCAQSTPGLEACYDRCFDSNTSAVFGFCSNTNYTQGRGLHYGDIGFPYLQGGNNYAILYKNGIAFPISTDRSGDDTHAYMHWCSYPTGGVCDVHVGFQICSFYINPQTVTITYCYSASCSCDDCCYGSITRHTNAVSQTFSAQGNATTWGGYPDVTPGQCLYFSIDQDWPSYGHPYWFEPFRDGSFSDMGSCTNCYVVTADCIVGKTCSNIGFLYRPNGTSCCYFQPITSGGWTKGWQGNGWGPTTQYFGGAGTCCSPSGNW